MSIGIDAEAATQFQSAAQPPPIEVEPPRIAVDLNGNPVLGAGDQNALDINLVTGTAQQLPAGHVADDANEWIGGRSYETLGLCFPVKPELAVNAADNEVKTA